MGIVTLASSDTAKSFGSDDKFGIEGLKNLPALLQPLKLQLGNLGRIVETNTVEPALGLYPDAIRLLAQVGLLGDAGPSRFTEHAEKLLLEKLGRIPSDATVADGPGGVAESVEGSAGSVKLILLDSFQQVELLDLRALGAVLWKVFVGDACALSERNGNLSDLVTFQPLLVHSVERPFEAVSAMYDWVSGAPDAALQGRLATIQRLVVSYSRGKPGLERVLDRAAQSFGRWASGRADIAPIGRKGRRDVSYALPIGCNITLCSDDFSAKEGE